LKGAARYLLLAALGLLSLALCTASVTLWVRSYWICDSYRPRDADLIAYQSYQGALHYVHVMPQRLAQSVEKYPAVGWSTVPAQQAQVWQEWNGPVRGTYTAVGFAYTNSHQAYTIAAVPYWLLAVLFAIFPGMSIPNVVRWIKKVPIRCQKCGKKVSGLTTTCPRCGHTIVETVAPPPPTMEAKPPPRPTKRVQAVVIKTAKPDRSRSLPRDDSGRSAL
jgi:DNA-directed RNA polymerase subunit RPC12/RpoP